MSDSSAENAQTDLDAYRIGLTAWRETVASGLAQGLATAQADETYEVCMSLIRALETRGIRIRGLVSEQLPDYMGSAESWIVPSVRQAKAGGLVQNPWGLKPPQTEN